MSNIASGWAWKQQGLKTSEKMTLLALADHSDDEGACWPGQRGLAKKTGLTRNTVKLAIRSLLARGLMSSSLRVRDDNSRASNLYILNLNEGVGQSLPHPGAIDNPGVGQPATQHEPSEEPPSNHSSILGMFDEKELRELHLRFPGLDFQYEAQKCTDWWAESNKTMKRPRTSFKNWLEIASDKKVNSNGNHRGNTQPSKSTVPQIKYGVRDPT